MRYFSTFSGIGGFELGIKLAYEQISGIKNISKKTKRQEADKKIRGKKRQFKQLPEYAPARLSCIGYSEIDKYATKVYQKHFPEHKNYGDITKINPKELPDFDLLVGGFPCQSFSMAGKRRGFEDTRGTLFFEIARIVREKQPRLLLLENVKGLLSHGNGSTFYTIITTLDELGYDCQWQVLNSKNHGVPQNRERVFIIGHLRGTSRPEVFPFGQNSYSSPKLSGQYSNTLTARYYAGQANGTYIAESKFNEQKIRRLTPTECERLQGFPDGWTEVGMEFPVDEYHKGEHKILKIEIKISDSQRYKMLGNAVTVNVVQSIMEKMIDTINK